MFSFCQLSFITWYKASSRVSDVLVKNNQIHPKRKAIGLSVYSNSKASVLSYLSLIENLWLESEIHEQLKESRSL